MVDQVDIYWLHRDDVSRPVGDILETLNGFLQAGTPDSSGYPTGPRPGFGRQTPTPPPTA